MMSQPWPLPQRGVLTNVHEFNVPPDALLSGSNWLYRRGEMIKRPGLAGFADNVNERPMGFMAFNHPLESDRIVMGTDAGWHHYDPITGTWTDVTEAGNALRGGPLSHCQFRTLDSSGQLLLLGVNGSDQPKLWDGETSAYRDIGGAPPKALAMAVSADRLILAEDLLVYVSDWLNPDSGYSGENQIFRLADTEGNIIAMNERGNLSTSIYKEKSVYTMTAQIDRNAPFRVDLVRKGIRGPVSPAALFELEDGSDVYLANNGAVQRFDGVNVVSLGEHIQAYIQATWDVNYAGRSWGYYDHYYNEIWFFFPTSGDAIDAGVMITWPDQAMFPVSYGNHSLTAGLHMNVADPIAYEDLAGVIDAQTLTFEECNQIGGYTIIGDPGGQVYTATGGSDGANDITSTMETGYNDFGDRRRFKTINDAEWWIPYIVQGAPPSETILVKLGHTDQGETKEYTATKPIDLHSKKEKKTHHMQSARAFTMHISSSGQYQTTFGGAVMNGGARGTR